MAYGQLAVDKLTSSTGAAFSPASSVMRNRIINGAMVIDQRNAGASTTPSATATNIYTLDRWVYFQSVASKFAVQQNAGSVTSPVGFSNYLGLTSQSAYSIGTNDYFGVQQTIEGFNTSDLGWGTANAKTVTLSFQVYSSLTGTFGGSIQNATQGRSYPFTYTVSSANTWTSISVTIAGDTSGTWVGSSSAGSIRVNFGLGMGSSFSGTASSWAGSNYLSATGAVSVVGTSGATFYITGVQLEVGSVASSFEYRQYGQELALCQRYYQYISAATYANPFIMTTRAATTKFVGFQLPVALRASPTIATNSTGTVRVIYSGTYVDSTTGSVAVGGVTPTATGYQDSAYVQLNYTGAMSTVGDTANTLYAFMINQGQLTFSSEL